MAFKMKGFPMHENKPHDDDSEELTNKQKRQSRRQRNKYNKKALKNKPLSKDRIKFFEEKINNPNTSKESVEEFKKLLKLNKRINK